MNKTEIIKTAFRVWGRDFYRKTSLSQLSRQLRVSKPALYRHFESKQALTSAMADYFLDDFAETVRQDFERALNTQDADEGFFIIINSIAAYFAKNGYSLVFSLINIYDRNLDGSVISERMKSKGVDFSTLPVIIERKYDIPPEIINLISATLTFNMANFHRVNNSLEKTISEEKIQEVVSSIYKISRHGLGFPAEKTLDFESLEKMVDGTMHSEEPEPLFKAVAEAVAEAGPWGTSMEMVAKRMGLSKSSLYGHFKNRKDMLRRLFKSEFKRIMEFARNGINLSKDSAQQLYLGIYSIAVYLRSRPEILIVLGWIRTRRLDLGKPDKNTEFFRLFEDINIFPAENSSEEEKQRTSHWILFLLINVLSQPYLRNNEIFSISSGDVHNNDIRLLYKFITLGLGGFIR